MEITEIQEILQQAFDKARRPDPTSGGVIDAEAVKQYLQDDFVPLVKALKEKIPRHFEEDFLDVDLAETVSWTDNMCCFVNAGSGRVYKVLIDGFYWNAELKCPARVDLSIHYESDNRTVLLRECKDIKEAFKEMVRHMAHENPLNEVRHHIEAHFDAV